jgi:hypothetical protein
MRRGLLILAASASLAFQVRAQEPSMQPTKLTLKSAAAPLPALKYLLLPEVRDLQPGNAVAAYMRAHAIGRYRYGGGKTEQEIDKLMELPFEEFQRVYKSGAAMPPPALEDIDRAARREYWDWEMVAKLRLEGFMARVDEAQILRQVYHFLAYRAEVELAKGEFDKAAYTIQTILAMSRHMADGPTLIHQLVGAAGGIIALYQVEVFIQQPDAPNLYWALAALPLPFIDNRKGFEGERLAIEGYFSELKKMDKEALSQKELQDLTNKCFFVSFSSLGRQKDVDFRSKLQLVGQVIQYYPAARKALIDQGRKAEEVDALPMLQVVVMHNYQICRRVQDDMVKWTYVPFWQGFAHLEEIDAELRKQTFFPFHLLLPGVKLVHEATVRLDRRIAALRCVEALRLHVAQTGKVPGSLDEITLVPVPLDPFTGKSFQYTATNGVVTLYGPPPPGRPVNEGTVVNYQITIKR